MLGRLRDEPVLHPDVIGVVGDPVRAALADTLTREVERLVIDSLADRPAGPGLVAGTADALDVLLDALEAEDRENGANGDEENRP